MMEWEKQLIQQHEEESNINNNNNNNTTTNNNNISNKNGMFVKVMTDEQMEILRKQIAAYATICDNLVDMHKSLTSNPLLHSPGDRLGNLYSDPLVTSVGHKITGRQRWTPTTVQLQILEHMFDQGNGTPTKQRIKDITSELSQHGQISETNVYNWFQNRRARSKRKQQVATPNNGESEVEAEVESTNDIETKSANQSPRAEKTCLLNPEISSGMQSVDLQVIKPVFASNESAKPSRSLGPMSFYDSMVSTPKIDHLVGKIEDSGSYNSYMRAEDFDLS